MLNSLFATPFIYIFFFVLLKIDFFALFVNGRIKNIPFVENVVLVEQKRKKRRENSVCERYYNDGFLIVVMILADKTG